MEMGGGSSGGGGGGGGGGPPEGPGSSKKRKERNFDLERPYTDEPQIGSERLRAESSVSSPFGGLRVNFSERSAFRRVQPHSLPSSSSKKTEPTASGVHMKLPPRESVPHSELQSLLQYPNNQPVTSVEANLYPSRDNLKTISMLIPSGGHVHHATNEGVVQSGAYQGLASSGIVQYENGSQRNFSSCSIGQSSAPLCNFPMHNAKDLQFAEAANVSTLPATIPERKMSTEQGNTSQTTREGKMENKDLPAQMVLASLEAHYDFYATSTMANKHVELIDDEHLELLKLAASSKGLFSFKFLDSETLQQLDFFRDKLSAFPPESVHLKKPFSIAPWSTSDENVGSLLMVWKFLISFRDVLQLQPFTLDEFEQSLHDNNSMLLGMIHISLLKPIIEDIDGALRSPAIMSGANETDDADHGCYPHIVQGAHAWGFDIYFWTSHLNLLTWPELLRQVALAAGFGPPLEQWKIGPAYFLDKEKGNDWKNAVSTSNHNAAAGNGFPSGAMHLSHAKRPSKAGNAFLSRGIGFLPEDISQQGLTPGTLRFAAFHVLSFEGDEGLTVVELVDRIQKSGLKDLSNSKKPSSFISTVLSKDTKYFERVAPGRYCVKLAFRKDPPSADLALLSAREQLKPSKHGLLEKVENVKEVENYAKAVEGYKFDAGIASEPKETCNEANLDETDPCSTNMNMKGSKSVKANVQVSGDTIKCHTESNAVQEDAKKDGPSFGEAWVQGLTKGDYFDLPAEQRLSALAALIELAMEGKLIRTAVEEQLEKSNTLKLKYWADAKVNSNSSEQGCICEPQFASLKGKKVQDTLNNVVAKGTQTPLLGNKDNINDGNPQSVSNDELFSLKNQNVPKDFSSSKNSLQEASPTNLEVPTLHQFSYTDERSRLQLLTYLGHQAENKHPYRFLPLGQDRRRNRYWQFSVSSSPDDPGSGRIFIESTVGIWRIIDTPQAFDALVAALDKRGYKEFYLLSMLQKIEITFKEATKRGTSRGKSLNSIGDSIVAVATDMTASCDCTTGMDKVTSAYCAGTSGTSEQSASFRIEINHQDECRSSMSYQGFNKWMWSGCYNSNVLRAFNYEKTRCFELLRTCHVCYCSYFAGENHCTFCHKNFPTSNSHEFRKHVAQCEENQKIDPAKFEIPVPSVRAEILLLKVLLAHIEVKIPPEVLKPYWKGNYRKLWILKLQSSTSCKDLFETLDSLERGINCDCMPSDFMTTHELFHSRSVMPKINSVSEPLTAVWWVPSTISALAWRIFYLDSCIPYMLSRLPPMEGEVAR